MNFIFEKALLSLLFYTDNPYFFTTFSKFVSLLFPYFSVDGHLKACIEVLPYSLSKDNWPLKLWIFSGRTASFKIGF